MRAEIGPMEALFLDCASQNSVGMLEASPYAERAGKSTSCRIQVARLTPSEFWDGTTKKTQQSTGKPCYKNLKDTEVKVEGLLRPTEILSDALCLFELFSGKAESFPVRQQCKDTRDLVW